MQEIIIYMDDSGKLTKNENYTIYGGLVYLSKPEHCEMTNKFKNIIEPIKCNYCSEKKPCSKNCPELKSSIIKDSLRRQIINLCKTKKVFALVIDNNKVQDRIMNDKAARGRFIDYTHKRTIKGILQCLILEQQIDPYKPINLTIYIDEQTTKSNGYYSLKDGIHEEFIYGVSNFNYAYYIQPILFCDFRVDIHYMDSKKNSSIQLADIIAGTTRKIMKNQKFSMLDRIKKIESYCWYIHKMP